MIGCLISVIIFAIVVLIVRYVIHTVVGMFTAIPHNVLVLVDLLLGLIVLLYALQCIGIVDSGTFSFGGRGKL